MIVVHEGFDEYFDSAVEVNISVVIKGYFHEFCNPHCMEYIKRKVVC